MENDETTAGSPQAPDGERPRQRPRRGAASTSSASRPSGPAQAGEGEIGPVASDVAPGRSTPSSRRSRATAPPAEDTTTAAPEGPSKPETAPSPSARRSSSSRRDTPPAEQPAAPTRPARQRPPSRSRRGQETLPGIGDATANEAIVVTPPVAEEEGPTTGTGMHDMALGAVASQEGAAPSDLPLVETSAPSDEATDTLLPEVIETTGSAETASLPAVPGDAYQPEPSEQSISLSEGAGELVPEIASVEPPATGGPLEDKAPELAPPVAEQAPIPEELVPLDHDTAAPQDTGGREPEESGQPEQDVAHLEHLESTPALSPEVQSEQSTPEEARSRDIATALRGYFATLPDPGDDALRPASFLAPLATELRAAGVQLLAKPGPAVASTPETAAADDLDVSASLDGLDLEHATITPEGIEEDGEIDAEERDRDSASGDLEVQEDGEPGTTEAEREDNRFGRSRRRRGRRGGRGGYAARTEGEPEELPLDRDQAALGAVEQAAGGDGAEDPGLAASAVVIPARPDPGARSWKEQAPRRPWLAGPTPAASSTGREQPALPAPTIDRRDDDPLGATRAVEQLPFATESFRAPAGDSAFDRVLDRQATMLQAFLERQSRLLESVATSVTAMRRTIEDLIARQERIASEQHTGLPRTGIFVDAPNVWYAADAGKITLDFSRMLTYLSRGREVVHAIAYAPVTDDAREGQRYEMQRFVAPFARKGFKMVTKPLKRYPDGTAKGNFDIELAIDIVTMSDRLDLVVLVSGDSDFSRLVELVQSKGVRVEVVAFASSVATELVHMADVFIDIGQHLDHFRQL